MLSRWLGRLRPATAKGAWRPHWDARFDQRRDVTPAAWTVIVPADRGLDARGLLRAIAALGWHPFVRIHRQGQYRPADTTDYRPLSAVLRPGGTPWRGRATCCKTRERQLDGPLLTCWDAGDADPWLMVTDLPPEADEETWYGMRARIEVGSKDAKRGGWQWEQTKLSDPQRAERLWLALATLWVVSVGCAAEAAQPTPALDHLPATHCARRSATGRQAPRARSCFRRGRLALVATVIQGEPLPAMRLEPEPRPKRRDTAQRQNRLNPRASMFHSAPCLPGCCDSVQSLP